MKNRKKTRQCTYAFTLVEMLVVIAIIGILASLLMPSLRQALATSKTLSCANNMKQTHIAVTSFTGDYNGFLPNSVYNRNQSANYGELFPPASVLSEGALGIPFSNLNNSNPNVFWTYFSEGGQLSCPADERSSTLAKAMNSDKVRTSTYIFTSSYFSNYYNNPWGGDSYNRRKMSRIKRPSVLFMMLEAANPFQTNSFGSFGPKGWASSYKKYGFQHNINSGFNAGFFDGHVQFKHLAHEVEYALDYTNNYFITDDITKDNWE